MLNHKIILLTIFTIFVLPTYPSLSWESQLITLGSEKPNNNLVNSKQEWIEKAISAYSVGDYQKTIDLIESAFNNNRRQTSDVKVVGLNYLALAYDKLNKPDLSNKFIEEAIALSAELQPIIQGNIYNTSATIYYNQNRKTQSIETWQKAALFYQQAKNQEGVTESQLNIAQAYSDLGYFKKSRKLLETMAQEKESLSNNVKSEIFLSLGNIYQKVGEFDLAKKQLKKALKVAPNNQALALTYLTLGILNESLEQIEKGINVADNLNTKYELSIAAYNLSISQGNKDKADSLAVNIEDYYQSIPSSYRKESLYLSYLDNLIDRDSTQNNLSQTKLKQIQEQYQNNNTINTYILGLQGKIALKEDDLLVAENLTKKAYNLATTIEDLQATYQWQWQLGKINSQANNQDEARHYYQLSLDSLQVIRKNLVGLSTQKKYEFRTKIEPIYREYIELLIEQPSQENLIKARKTLENLKVAELENYFGTACLEAKPEKVDQIEKNAAIIYPIILDNKLAVITSVDKKLSLKTFDVSKEEITTTLDNFESHFSVSGSKRQREKLGKVIYDWLIDEKLFTDSKIDTVVLVPEGLFGKLPIDALWTGDNYLITKYRSVMTPSLELLPTNYSDSFSSDNLLLGGLSEARQGFAALPGVTTEINQIAEVTHSESLLNQQFTRTQLQSTLETTEANILHLATHGKFSSNPENTFILTWDNKINVRDLEEFLRVRKETPTLVPIELLILSACETAKGDEYAALGLAGVALKSGARSTIATLWAVSDDATPLLMETIYQGLSENQNKAEILRQAKLKLIATEKFNHPLFWSPYVLIGNWQ